MPKFPKDSKGKFDFPTEHLYPITKEEHEILISIFPYNNLDNLYKNVYKLGPKLDPLYIGIDQVIMHLRNDENETEFRIDENGDYSHCLIKKCNFKGVTKIINKVKNSLIKYFTNLLNNEQEIIMKKIERYMRMLIKEQSSKTRKERMNLDIYMIYDSSIPWRSYNKKDLEGIKVSSCKINGCECKNSKQFNYDPILAYRYNIIEPLNLLKKWNPEHLGNDYWPSYWTLGNSIKSDCKTLFFSIQLIDSCNYNDMINRIRYFSNVYAFLSVVREKRKDSNNVIGKLDVCLLMNIFNYLDKEDNPLPDCGGGCSNNYCMCFDDYE